MDIGGELETSNIIQNEIKISEVRKAKIRDDIKEIWVRGNLELVDDFYAANYVRHQPPFPDVNGAEAMKQWIVALRNAFSALQLAID
jgi:hypothetical protein